MNTQETIRLLLQREAETHEINPILPRATITKARLRRSLVVLGMSTVVASVALGGIGVARYLDDDRGPVAPSSSEGDAVTSRNEAGAPLVLITEQGWRVTYVDQYGADEGEMAFENESHEMDFYWRPADSHDSYVQDRRADAERSWETEVLGHEAVLIKYQGATDFTALWLDGDLSMELRGVFPDVDHYRAIAAALEPVDEETWLAAMPESVVPPSERAATVEEMLADIPVHPDVDVEELKSGQSVSDRYQLGAQVTHTVVCAWIGQWLDARADDKERPAREAMDAITSARDWSILIEMKDQGGWSGFLWEYADALASGQEDRVEEALSPNGNPSGFAAGLDCEE